MERKPTRGTKPKNVPLPGNLITLGNKPVNRNDGEKSAFPIAKPGCSGNDRGVREGQGSSSLHQKKTAVKPGGYIMGLPRPTGHVGQVFGESSVPHCEEWETIAREVEPNNLQMFIDIAEDEQDYERTHALLCGAIKQLRASKSKPDLVHCMHLLLLTRQRPHIFSRSVVVTQALCSLLKRDHAITFKAKTNPNIPVMAACILLAAYQEERNWPDIFIRVFIEDSLNERVWVDMDECRGFVDNIITAFGTKMPPRTARYTDFAMNRPECPSPPITAGADCGDTDSEMSLECKESLDVFVCNRYAGQTSFVEDLVLDTVKNQMSLRHQNVDSVARNFIRFLSSVTGIVEVRKMISTKLENWLQSPKLQRPASDLLMSLCMNCNLHSNTDVETIANLIRYRIKHKPLLNHYLSCIKELMIAHPENIQTAIHNTIYNELSNSRNPSNMNILSAIFQSAPEHSAILLAEEFQELLCHKDDFNRALRVLFREITRGLRYDIAFQKFCQGLMSDRRLSIRETPELCNRMFHGIVDIISMVMFVMISPIVRENATMMLRGEQRDVEVVRRYQESVASIQQDALNWMHRTVPKLYAPSNEEYIRSLYKLLMLENPESYSIKDSYPSDNDRPLFFKLASEVPLKQETLISLLMIAVTKEQWVKPQDLIELTEKVIRRATQLQFDDVEVFHVDETKIIDLIFNLSLYIPPEHTQLPHGYRPPKMAVTLSYWRAWMLLLLVTAHNPSVFGRIAWESYPTLRMFMEMCITNSFSYPPETLLAAGEKPEDIINQELMLASKDKEIILEFEEFLAQKSITEQNSLLLSTTILMEPTGLPRKPPLPIIEQLKALNASHRVGHLLCRCRSPDFLVDIIARQGTSQSMPWLAELVQSHENAFAMLPVQCLCEFLLSSDGSSLRHVQLVAHLRALLREPSQAESSTSSLEILEYFLRRLSWQQAGARSLAVRALHRLLQPAGPEAESEQSDAHTWLMQHLTALPCFSQVRSMVNQAVRAAIQVETEPSIVSAYLRFLAIHTQDDSLQEQTGLVSDLAQVIVERCTICSAMLPSPDRPNSFPHANSTLKAFFIIFVNYMRAVRGPANRDAFWSDSQDQVRVQWASQEEAVMHILVIHAIVILLTFGPNASCAELFNELMAVWFPEQMPQAFLVDTSEEALLFPDWLKLKMIRSTVSRLVDAALKDLEPSQLVLFIQSFGIPVASMSRLLSALDAAVASNLSALKDAVLDKSHKAYMAQLLEVQHSRGAMGGEAFAAVLGSARAEDHTTTRSSRRCRSNTILQPLSMFKSVSVDISADTMYSFFEQCFTKDSVHQQYRHTVTDTMQAVLRHISHELQNPPDRYGIPTHRPYTAELFKVFEHYLQYPDSVECRGFVERLHIHHDLSAPLFTLLYQLVRKQDPQMGTCLNIVNKLLRQEHSSVLFPLTAVLKMFPVVERPKTDAFAIGRGCVARPSPVIPPVYDSRSSPFSIANLAGTADTSPSKLSSALPCNKLSPNVHSMWSFRNISGEGNTSAVISRTDYLHPSCKIDNEDDILRSLLSAPAAALERHLRGLVELAANDESTTALRSAVSRLLIIAAGKVKQEAPLPPQSIALLIDWLQVLDPEYQENLELRRLLLFAKFKDQPDGIGLGGFSQAYLLGAFIQKANWNTLEETVQNLLSSCDTALNAAAVLDFVWSVQRVPKLWQGRERRTPRHSKQPLLMDLNQKQLLVLAQYVLAEKMDFFASKELAKKSCKDSHHSDRMSLLLQWYQNNEELYDLLIKQLKTTAVSTTVSAECAASQSLLYELYLRRPCVLKHMSADVLKLLPRVTGDGESSADVAIHCLLTMVCSPDAGRDFRKRLHELEMAVRSVAARHPVLVLRHCHLIYTGLDGLSHLNLYLLKNNNYLEVLRIIAGVLHLLHPHIFSPKYNSSVKATLNCYFDIFDHHMTAPELLQVDSLIVELLHTWLATDRTRALIFLAQKLDFLKSYSQKSKAWRPLLIAASAASTLTTDQVSEDPTEAAPPISSANHNWLQAEADQVANKLLRSVMLDTDSKNEELKDAWKQLRVFASRAPISMLESRFGNALCNGVQSTHRDVRSAAWSLLAQVLIHNPAAGPQYVSAVLHALDSSDCAVARTAVESLPEVILTMHSSAPDLLTMAFLAVTTKAPSSTASLVKALSLLTIHSGA